MGLSPLYSSDGSPLLDGDGNQIYVMTTGPDPKRVYKVPPEIRVGKVPPREGQ